MNPNSFCGNIMQYLLRFVGSCRQYIDDVIGGRVRNAISSGNHQYLRLYLKLVTFNLNAPLYTIDGITPLSDAVRGGDEKMVRLLIEYKADTINGVHSQIMPPYI